MALIDKDAYKDAIGEALTKGGFTNVPVVWKAEARPHYGPANAIVILDVSAIRNVGQDVTKRIFNGGTQLYDVYISGTRDVVVQVRIEAETALTAQEMAHAIGVHALSFSVSEIFREACTSINEVGAAVSLEYVWDNREVSAVNLELFATVEFSVLDPEPEGAITTGLGTGQNWIENVTPLTGTYS